MYIFYIYKNSFYKKKYVKSAAGEKNFDENFSSSSENTKNHVFRGAAGAAKLKMGYEKMGGPKFWRVGGGGVVCTSVFDQNNFALIIGVHFFFEKKLCKYPRVVNFFRVPRGSYVLKRFPRGGGVKCF